LCTVHLPAYHTLCVVHGNLADALLLVHDESDNHQEHHKNHQTTIGFSTPAEMLLNKTDMASGNLATIPAKINKLIPFPIPHWVILLPIQIKSIDPVVTVSIATNVNGRMPIVITPGMELA
jgi:hypothetical protein